VKGLISEWGKRYVPAKEVRPEIVYVTHNANLVVNTDANGREEIAENRIPLS
jgi:hypothetical protein